MSRLERDGPAAARPPRLLECLAPAPVPLAPLLARREVPTGLNPDETLRGRADALARGETATPPRLGVAIAPGHVARRLRRGVGLPDTDGLLIPEVAEASPAARAGPAPGDLIVAAAGQPARTPDDLFDALAAARGGTLELNVVRGTGERTLQVTFTEPGHNA